MKKLALIILTLAIFACTPNEKQTIDNNKPASKEEWLSYLKSIKNEKCISGQFIRWNYNASLQEITAIHDSSDQWLGMLGADYYGNFQDSLPSPRCEYKLSNDVIKDYYKNHPGIVNLSVHFINPQNMGSAWFQEIDFDSVLIEGCRVNKIFMEELDSVAAGIKDLSDAGIMVMFRPFHEMSGGWFWWGKQKRLPELWRITYDYIVKEKGLDNLLWCWGPSAQHTELDQYYPGDEYVDLVALDAYTPNLPERKASYEAILKYNKPFGWGEYGCQGGPVFYEKIEFDYSILLKWIKEDFPETTFLLTWRDAKGMVDKDGVRKLLNDPMIINRDELLK